MSTWKIPCSLPGIVPRVFSLLFFVLFITSQVVPNFNTFQLFPCVFFCSVHYNAGGPYVQNISIYFYCFFFFVLFFTMKVGQMFNTFSFFVLVSIG